MYDPYTMALTEKEVKAITKLAENKFSCLFAERYQRKLRTLSDPSECRRECQNRLTDYDIVYWTWFYIKRKMSGKRGLSYREKGRVYNLASNPTNNLKLRIKSVVCVKTCIVFFMIVYKAYKRFHRS